MKILFSGGGTLGPVTPLLAMQETIRAAHQDADFVWIGTKNGPERSLVEQAGMRFFPIPSGKLRRYASVENLTDLTRIVSGFLRSFRILWREKPDVCISAGGFISVPVHIACWLLGIPAWIHEQDIDIGLASRLLSPLAARITTATEANAKKFPRRKTRWLGNPIRQDLFSGSLDEAVRRFGLDTALPVLFATGGGTGSAKINDMIAEAVPHLAKLCNIIHTTGRDRPQEAAKRAAALFPHYHRYSFFSEEMKHAYAAADIVVARAGFGTLAELAALRKAAIFVPKPGHQEENVKPIAKAKAGAVLDERMTSGYHLAGMVKELLRDTALQKRMGERLHELFPPAKPEDILDILGELIP